MSDGFPDGDVRQSVREAFVSLGVLLRNLLMRPSVAVQVGLGRGVCRRDKAREASAHCYGFLGRILATSLT